MISVCTSEYSHAVTKQRNSSTTGLTKLLLASVGLFPTWPLFMATSCRFTTLCVLWSTIRGYEWVGEGQRQRFQPGTISWCMADLPGVRGPVFVFALYYMCFYFISASFRKHCIIISSWSRRRDYFKWLWVIVLEGPAGRALGTGESNITVRLLTVSWTKPLQSKKNTKTSLSTSHKEQVYYF